MSHVVVVGAGLAGLVAARRLAAAGATVTVVERRETVGGRVRSRVVDGFTCDRGFQVLFGAYPAVRRELDLDALDIRRFAPGACLARPGRRSILSDPLRDPGALVETLFNREVSTADKLRTLALTRELRGSDPETLLDGPDATIREGLADRGFSERYVERFVAPFYGGITLDRSLSTSNNVFEYTFRAMSEGWIGVPAEGMGAIPAQLAADARAAGATIETGETVEAIEAGGATLAADGGTRTEVAGSGRSAGVAVETDARTIDADAVVVAADPATAGSLTGVETIPTTGKSCVTQHLALNSEPGLDAGERIVLDADGDGDAPNTVSPMSAVAPEYAPDDRGLLAATFLDRAALDADADALMERTRAALSSWFPEHGFDDLRVVATDRIEFAQFEQPPGFREGLPPVDAPRGPVCLAGDYTEWCSIQGAMASGRTAAAAVREELD